MKRFGRFARASAVVLLAFALAACGGPLGVSELEGDWDATFVNEVSGARNAVRLELSASFNSPLGVRITGSAYDPAAEDPNAPVATVAGSERHDGFALQLDFGDGVRAALEGTIRDGVLTASYDGTHGGAGEVSAIRSVP